MDYAAEKSAFTPSKEVQYTMPDGQKLSIGQERFQCTEALFQPTMIGREHVGTLTLLVCCRSALIRFFFFFCGSFSRVFFFFVCVRAV
jgi:Actin